MKLRGAGGTDGGTGPFFLGLIMMCAGGYLLFNSIIVRTQFGLTSRAFQIGDMPITTGMILVPFIFGVGLIFYNSKSFLGWTLSIGALVALVFGVIANLHIRLSTMSAFELLTILILLVGGIGLFLRSLRPTRSESKA